jgi:hypothetical protein
MYSIFPDEFWNITSAPDHADVFILGTYGVCQPNPCPAFVDAAAILLYRAEKAVTVPSPLDPTPGEAISS